MEVFRQTVWMTVVGMSMTFAALGLLILVMIVLTRWTGGRAEAMAHREEPSGAIPIDRELEEAEQAAAVAVAIALAQAARRIHPAHAWHSALPGEDVNAWQAYARGQQLELRNTHQALRW